MRKNKDSIIRNWHLIDLNGQILGRAATQISRYLQGKNKVNYTPNVDGGDFVVVINASRVVLSGQKEKTKIYKRYSGYPSGQRKIPYLVALNKNPSDVVKHAVYGMLPKNKLRSLRLSRLYIYKDTEHPYADKFLNK